MNISFNFDGKVVLITGAGSGIGAQTAAQFARAGAQVVISGRDGNSVRKVAKKCDSVSPGGLRAVVVVADLTSEVDCFRAIETTVLSVGKLHVLVHNSDMVWQSCQINDPKFVDNYKHIMETNLNSFVYLTHYSVKYLMQTTGNIVNNTSIVDIVSSPLNSPNCMAKSALNVFTQYLSTQLQSKGVRVNSINPGGSQNNVHLYTSIEAMMNSTYTQLRNVSKTAVPVDDIVNGILYLASDQATMVNGFNFVANCCCCRCFSDELRAFYYINSSNNSGKCSKFF
ncbi:unnamed protein product [Oppiella nova]|uniref:Uncharacterized protein n=1 Tax=Oppiella nova TaxID=334625 RepID=A0A7R9LVL1_9ACAR|nr:unnamed protein product [Oppiella nova]CAG2167398.1 unnamed protein product [Oppiella nova]